jgi:hypothetical protein
MTVDKDAVAASSAEQLVEGHTRHLRLDVPERGIDRCDRAHRDRALAPVGAAIKILPDVLDPARIHADQAGNDMVAEVSGERQLAAVERRIADPVDP